VDGQRQARHDGHRGAGDGDPDLAHAGRLGLRADLAAEHLGAQAAVVVLGAALGPAGPVRHALRVLAGHPRAQLGGGQRDLAALIPQRELDGQPDHAQQHRGQDDQLDGAGPALGPARARH
jgi:hypothetical protein